MTSPESALSELAARLAGTDATLSTSLRDILTVALQELIEAELTATIGAAPGERCLHRLVGREETDLAVGHLRSELCARLTEEFAAASALSLEQAACCRYVGLEHLPAPGVS